MRQSSHSQNQIGSLAVLVGYKCNFACAHCITAGKTGALSETDNKRIVSAIERYGIRELHFVGGEPSLFVEAINKVLSRLSSLDKIKVRITTNGSFARTISEAEGLLQRFKKIDFLELSYDKFHKKFLPEKNIRNLFLTCRKRGVRFGVLFSAESPMDLVLLKDLNAVGKFPISLQYVVPFGAAKKNSIAWRHRSPEAILLGKKCPTSNKLIYICQQGFTVCCSALTLCLKPQKFVHTTPEKHFSSRFYGLVSSCSMGEIKDRFDLKGPLPEDRRISVCTVCEYLFSAKFPELAMGSFSK